MAPAVVHELADAGFLANAVAPTAVRVAPPLVISPADLRTFVGALPAALDRAAAGDFRGRGARMSQPPSAISCATTTSHPPS